MFESAEGCGTIRETDCVLESGGRLELVAGGSVNCGDEENKLGVSMTCGTDSESMEVGDWVTMWECSGCDLVGSRGCGIEQCDFSKSNDFCREK